MKTLIELYDERPIENVLASEVFQPERTVFLCPAEIAQNQTVRNQMTRFFEKCIPGTETIFMESSPYNTDKLLKQLQKVVSEYEDCVIDITGGTDAALFACGKLCAITDVPAFTYSRKRNCFYDIHKAPFSDGSLPCMVQHTVEDCFLMAGGALRMGRVDNRILKGYLKTIDPFFELYMKYRKEWNDAVTYMQRVSQNKKEEPVSLHVDAPVKFRDTYRKIRKAPKELLKDLAGIGFLNNLDIGDEQVSFDFRDLQIRTWLRDVGSVLELYIWKACVDSSVFNDVMTSAIVDWEGDYKRDNVTNEIDVMAMLGIVPLFISCKTCDITTEALNELAVLKDRFGGKGAKAIIVTAENCRTITRHRATELGIEVIDLEDLQVGNVRKQIIRMVLEE